jgi:hypothetical protein
MWQAIDYTGEAITSKTSCVLVRKPNARKGWNVSVAYMDVKGIWRLDRGGWPEVRSEKFTEWCEIPL